MSRYQDEYERITGKQAPQEAQSLDPLFQRIDLGKPLPPRGQQAVDAGLTAHSLNDSRENPAVYSYYQWVLNHYFNQRQIKELTAKLIGMSFVCANVFKTNFPQPMTLNPWQIAALTDFPLANRQIVVVENNGIFASLLQQHPDWPLIDQGGNDFNEAYVQLIRRLEQRGVSFTYLGDLDSEGIRIADGLFARLANTTIETFTALQTGANVMRWVMMFGKPDSRRTQYLTMQNSVFQNELNTIHLMGKFVEQEQLLTIYEQLISEWLLKDNMG